MTNLSVGLTHSLVEGLVVVDVGLEDADVAGHTLDLAPARPSRHTLHILNATSKLGANYFHTGHKSDRCDGPTI